LPKPKNTRSSKVSDFLSLLTNLTDTDLNLIIEEVYRKEVAKMPRQPPWDYRNPMPISSGGYWLAYTMRENMSVVNKTSLKEHSANVDTSRKEAINKLSEYFVKDYYNKTYDEQIQMKKGGKLYRSKKHKKCKSKRCHKKNIRKTRRRM